MTSSIIDTISGLATGFDEGAVVGLDPRADLSSTSLYFRLRDARSDARAEERASDNDPTASETGLRHWRQVSRLAEDALSTRGKDIEIAAWMTESLVRTHGIAGLLAGCVLMRSLVLSFWSEGLFPLPDEDGMEGRLAPIGGMSGGGSDGTLLQPLRKLALFEDANATAVTFWQFEQARTAAAVNSKKTDIGERFEELDRLARGSGRPALERLARETTQAAAAWVALEQALGAVVPEAEVPPMRRVRDLLDGLKRMLETYVPSDVLADAMPEAVAGSAAGVAGPKSLATADAMEREALLDEVLRIATLFRKAEPNSPFSYTIETAVRRARMPWPTLLQEMLPDDGVRNTLLFGLGIHAPSG